MLLRCIASWDGTSWGPLGSGLNGVARSLWVHNDTLLVGGHFSDADFAPARHVACWTGAHWDSVGAGLGGDDTEGVYAFTTYQGRLVAGGEFSGSVAERRAGYWLRLSYLNGYVNAMTVHEGRLIVGGYFPRTGGFSTNGIARWVE